MSFSLKVFFLRLAGGERNLVYTYCKAILFAALYLYANTVTSQNNTLSANEFKKLSLEELMNLEVTSLAPNFNYEMIEACIMGQDLLAKKYIEFNAVEIPRSVYGKISIRF